VAKSVAVFGAGPAGLTVANELRCRGYDVTVYERRPEREIGGKARTQYWTTAAGVELPGEHGFRFFPAFYSLIDDTLQRIPLDPATETPADLESALSPTNGASVFDNFVEPQYQAFGRPGQRLAKVPRRPFGGANDLTDIIRFFYAGLDIPFFDLLRIGLRMMTFLSSCDDRRRVEYEPRTFWDFMGLAEMSSKTQKTLRRLPRCLVAMDAETGNARTLNNIAFLLMADLLNGAQRPDRILKGPTSETWIRPWYEWLKALGVEFRFGADKAVVGFDLDAGGMSGATLADGTKVVADYYVSAVPLEVMHGLVSDAMALRSAPLAVLRGIDLGAALSWMVGAQFYLEHDVPVVDGHVAYLESAWSVTSISQAQFWDAIDFKNSYGKGVADGILSVDVSEWFRERGTETGKLPRQCSLAELREELIAQIGVVLTEAGAPILTENNVVEFHLDDDIVWSGGQITDNLSRLLVHPPGLWDKRPPADPSLGRFFLAGDYVQNDTDLATMEGANQAGRDAVNALLDADGSTQQRARSDDHLEQAEPLLLKAVKERDQIEFDAGRPPLMEFLFPFSALAAPDMQVGSEEQVFDQLARIEASLMELL